MRSFNSRRLTGPNLLWENPGAVIDVEFGEVDPEKAVSTWKGYARKMLDAIGWNDEQTCSRMLSAGASLAISAPLDGLYSACLINEWVWRATCYKLGEDLEPANFETDANELIKAIAEESNSDLIDLVHAAHRKNCTVLLDPDEISLGMGAHSEKWRVDELPQADALDWSNYRDIPIALITGTNGKTTSTRLASAIVKTVGLRPGMSSTDGIIVDGELVEKGDYSGPGGARAVLRNVDTEFALLETARGGLLRRGLGVTRADAALITNIASDHIGDFGVNNLEELADVKWIVQKAIDTNGTLVINADDLLLVKRGLGNNTNKSNIIWYSPYPENKLLIEHLEQGGTACTVIDNHLARVRGKNPPELLVPVSKVPLTHEGKALFNVVNALGVIGLTSAMRISDQAIVAGLKNFDSKDNPGRMNMMQINGSKVLVDFAHNTHGLQALLSFAENLEAKRRLILLGHAGDRTDEDIRDLARCTANMKFDRIIVKTMEKLRRGREQGEIENLLIDEFKTQGVDTKIVDISVDEISGIKAAIDWARADDLLILLVHEDKRGALQYLNNLQN